MADLDPKRVLAHARASFDEAILAAGRDVAAQVKRLVESPNPLALETQPLAPSAARSTEIRNREATLRRVVDAIAVLEAEAATIARRNAADAEAPRG